MFDWLIDRLMDRLKDYQLTKCRMTKYQNTQHVKDATDTWYIYTYRKIF